MCKVRLLRIFVPSFVVVCPFFRLRHVGFSPRPVNGGHRVESRLRRCGMCFRCGICLRCRICLRCGTCFGGGRRSRLRLHRWNGWLGGFRPRVRHWWNSGGRRNRGNGSRQLDVGRRVSFTRRGFRNGYHIVVLGGEESFPRAQLFAGQRHAAARSTGGGVVVDRAHSCSPLVEESGSLPEGACSVGALPGFVDCAGTCTRRPTSVPLAFCMSIACWSIPAAAT